MECHGPAWGLGPAIVWNALTCTDIAIGVICFLILYRVMWQSHIQYTVTRQVLLSLYYGVGDQETPRPDRMARLSPSFLRIVYCNRALSA